MLCPPSTAFADTISVEEVLSKWNALEEDSYDVSISWTEENWWAAGSQVDPNNPARVNVPLSDVSATSRYRLLKSRTAVLLDGTYSTPTGPNENPIQNHKRVEAFDGIEARFFYDDDRPFGEIRPTMFADPLDRLKVRPVYLFLFPRSLSKRLADSNGQPSIVEGGELADGVARLMWSPSVPGGPSIYVDIDAKSATFTPIGYKTVTSSQTISVVMTYSTGDTRSMLLNWEIVISRGETASSRIIEKHSGSVDRVETSLALPGALFKPGFPIGARVTDQVRQVEYIQREGNEKRLITLAELECRPSYERLVATASGQACGSQTPSALFWFYFLSINAVVIAIMIAVWRSTRITKSIWR